MNQKKLRARRITVVICRAAVIAAVYAALCFATLPLSFGVMQLRFAEGLALLPLFMPEAIAGLTVGCLVANIIGGVPIDMGLGTLATLAAASMTFAVGKFIRNKPLKYTLAVIPPIVINALIVPVVLLVAGFNASGGVAYSYWACAGFVSLGQLICVAGIGVPLAVALEQAVKHYNRTHVSAGSKKERGDGEADDRDAEASDNKGNPRDSR